MKRSCLVLLVPVSFICHAQDGVEKTINKANNVANKVSTVIAVFQPYLLKAQQLYADAKNTVQGIRDAAHSLKGNNNGNNSNNGMANNSGPGNNIPGNSIPGNSIPNNNNNNTGYGNTTGTTYNTTGTTDNGYSNNNGSFNQGQSTNGTGAGNTQYLPVNNPATVNRDGSGNWGNQDNGLYGNCLDALTGTVMGMGEAEDKPGSVDLMFFAPSDGQNTYYIMTPSFAHDNGTATYMTQHTSDEVAKWKTVTESEVALTRLTIGQFDQIQNNNQILNVVKNARNYAGYFSLPETKLEGMVFAVKVQEETRTVYALIAIDKHFGTSGSNGYLKIRVKAQGIDSNGDGNPDAANYIR